MQNYLSTSYSVVVVNYNRKQLLDSCLRSLEQQEDVTRVEIIVVDNGSSDGSVEMVEAQYSRCRFPVRLIRNTTNKGFCEANNQGIAVAAGEFVALLNNDAEAHPKWLAKMGEAVLADPEYGMVASKVLVWEDPRRIDKVGHLIFLDGQNRGRGTGELDAGQYDTMEEALWPDGCAALYRREMLEQIGGFDEDFFAYADDAELGLRARIAGWRCVYAPGAVVRHHRGATLGLQSMRRVELIERNRVLLVAKLFPWILIWLNGVLYGARLAAGAWASLLGKGEISRFPGLKNKSRVAMALMRADLEALRMIPKMLRKRRDLRGLRKLNTREVIALLMKYRIRLKELSQQST
ncbi:MAG: glycosyltransferase family 2 protein [Acidobacteria bacterium]|nr:glycosyltransferase family 2 protein [Acidobacteriota bacterium]